MKKKITVTFEYIFEIDDEDVENPDDYKKLDGIRESDYDNVDRPLNHMEDLDWRIVKSKVVDV